LQVLHSGEDCGRCFRGLDLVRYSSVHWDFEVDLPHLAAWISIVTFGFSFSFLQCGNSVHYIRLIELICGWLLVFFKEKFYVLK
jgi:hypothetical protein